MSLANDKGTPEVSEGKKTLWKFIQSLSPITENPSIPLNVSIQNLAQYKLALSKYKGYQKINAITRKLSLVKSLVLTWTQNTCPWNAMHLSLTLLDWVVSLLSQRKNNAFFYRFQCEKCNSALLHALFVKPWQISCRQRSLIIKTQNWISLHRQPSG